MRNESINLVCRDVGLPTDRVMLGHEVDDASDTEPADLSESTAIFAKLTPAQKARIVQTLQSRGHTVGYLGDAINDAPALRDADVGISVDPATDIARESADIILLEKSLLVLEDGVQRGREVYGNVVRYIKMTASSNFGNVFSVLIASAVLPFLPMLPVQLLAERIGQIWCVLATFRRSGICPVPAVQTRVAPFLPVTCQYLRAQSPSGNGDARGALDTSRRHFDPR